jgi:hypothetical protein
LERDRAVVSLTALSHDTCDLRFSHQPLFHKTLPFFYTLDLKKKYAPLALAGMALTLAVYDAAWGRYFIGATGFIFLQRPKGGNKLSPPMMNE